MKKKIMMWMIAALTLLIAVPAFAITACDNFGQDWTINVGAFGGSFPGSLVVSGCRDCNQTLGCGAAAPLDGLAVVTSGAAGAPYTIAWSMTAYRPGSGSCVSTHWNGSMPAGGSAISGTVSNEFGPFGAASITFGACRIGATRSAADPSQNSFGRWEAAPGDASGSSFIVP